MFDQRSRCQRFSPVEEMSEKIGKDLGEAQAAKVTTPTRVRTRFLGFRSPKVTSCDEELNRVRVEVYSDRIFPLGRVSIVGGPGTGRSFPLLDGQTSIGRADDQDIQLAFGDESISRQCHALITYYGAESGFLLRDGLKVNPVRLNGRAVREDVELDDGDLIQLGETTLLFMAFKAS